MAFPVLAAQADSLDWITITGSSDVAAIGYAADFGRVFTRFLDGTRYAWEVVPVSVWEQYKTAPSKGKFVYDVLRGAGGRRGLKRGSIDHVYVQYGPF